MTTFDPRANAQDFLNLPPPPGRTETQPVTQPATELPTKATKTFVVKRISVPASAKRLLEDFAKREGISSGAAALRMFASEQDRILVANALPDPGDVLASPPARKRPPLVDPVTVALYISPSQAAALTEFKERVTLSISAIITEAIERYCGAK